MGRKPIAVAATEKQLSSFEREFAENSAVCDRFMEHYGPKIAEARANRLDMEDQWLDDLRLWSCRLDDQGYVGRSNIFVPELHAQVELSVDKSMAALFPGPDLVKAVGINGTPIEKAEKIQNAVDYELNKAGIYIKQQKFERSKILYGTSVYKGGFRKDMRTVFTRNEKGQPIKDEVPKYLGVTWDTVDLFRWYIYPETGTLLDNDMLFEDQWMPKSWCEEQGFKNLDQVSESRFDKHHNWVDADRLEIVNITSAASVRKDMIFLTEVWTEMELPGSKGKVPVKATVANDGVVVSLKRNPYWSQNHPYLADTYVNRPGNIFYGFSLPDKIRSQQYQINDVTNHTMDSLSFSLNPITVVDPGLAGDINSMKFAPGARWFGSVEGIKPLAYPDLTPSGLRAIQEIRGQIGQFSDTQPGIAPQLQGKARSATQASIINQSVTQRQRVMAKSSETNVLGPMCEATHALLKQYMEDKWQIKSQGADAGEWIVQDVTPSDIYGEAEWIWLGASASEKTAIRSQQLLAFQQQLLQTASVLPPGEVDLAALSLLIAQEAFELKGVEHIFKSLRDKKTVDPEVENLALIVSRDVKIHQGDDDDFHIDAHRTVAEDKKLPKEVRLAALAHMRAHEEQKFAKQEVENLKAKMEAQQQAMAQGEDQMDGREGPQVPSPMEGQRGQTADFANIATGVRGVQ